MGQKLCNTIFKNPVICGLILMPFIASAGFTSLPIINNIYEYWKMAAICLLFIIWFMRRKIELPFAIIAIFLVIDCIMTIVYNGDFDQMLRNAVTLLSLCIIFSIAGEMGNVEFLKALSVIFDIMIIVNWLSIILYPAGINGLATSSPEYFLGKRNIMMRSMFPGICYTMMRAYFSKGKLDLRAIFIMIIGGASLVQVWSATALASYFLFCVLMLWMTRFHIPKWFTARNAIIFSLGVFAIVIVFRLQHVFSFVISGILHRDVTLTGRILLWDNAILNIAKAPLFGHGFEDLEVIGAKLFRYTNYDSAHNFILDILYQNGIVGLILIGVFFGKTAKKIDNIGNEKIKILFVSIAFTYGLMINFEPFINGDMRNFIALFIYINYMNVEKLASRYKCKYKIRIIK